MILFGHYTSRSDEKRRSIKKGVLKKFTKVTGK